MQKSNEDGGTMNGTTSKDRTMFYETLPANQLDLALFLEVYDADGNSLK
jgi:zinc protease